MVIRKEKSIPYIKIDHKMLIAVKLASRKRVQHLKDKAKDYAEKQARRICEKKSHFDVTDILQGSTRYQDVPLLFLLLIFLWKFRTWQSSVFF